MSNMSVSHGGNLRVTSPRQDPVRVARELIRDANGMIRANMHVDDVRTIRALLQRATNTLSCCIDGGTAT